MLVGVIELEAVSIKRIKQVEQLTYRIHYKIKLNLN